MPTDPADHDSAIRLADLRRSYSDRGLTESDLDTDPLTQFDAWLAAAAEAEVTEPNAMVLASADGQGRPSGRTVLLKGLDRGFVFYTNLESRKGRELAENPWATVVFGWLAMERQVIAFGAVERVDREDAVRYFDSRPHGSQLGAVVSPQSRVIRDRSGLDEAYAAALERWPEGSVVPLPEFWGGFRLVPERLEFWQGRRNRLHDRFRYQRDRDGWSIERLAP
jgi:pyridoxamine 5'-phosphate oxidase